MTPKVQLAVLDMAGTTVVDDGLVVRAFTVALEAVGLSAQDPAHADRLAYVRDTMGASKYEVFLALLGNQVDARRATSAFEAAVAQIVSNDGIEAIAGARSALARLAAADIRICLTTGFSPTTQALIVDRLGWSDLVDLTLAPGPGRRGRPHPDLVLAAVLALEVDDVRAVAVAGDTANDLWSGWRAGAGVVAGVLTGAHDRAELSAAPHTHILASIADLPAVLGLDQPAVGA